MKHSATTWGGDTTGDYACLNFSKLCRCRTGNLAMISGQDTAKGKRPEAKCPRLNQGKHQAFRKTP